MNFAEFLVRKTDLRECRIVADPDSTAIELQPGKILLKIDKFAFTANNVTYGVFGQAMQYWNFFPIADKWGRIPVWGYGDVVQSQNPAIAVGERIYGYLPMSTHIVLQPERVQPGSFMDGSAHRRTLPAAYQHYTRMQDRNHEDEQALLRPLFMTSFLIEDFLAENALFGARTVVVASASSKTALGLGFMLSRNRPQQCEVVGLTSPARTDFCTKVGYYDRVVAYPDLATLPQGPAVFVDMAGDGQLLHDVHHHFGEQLKHSCIVGATHWEQRATQHALPGAKPEFFFAPTRIAKRTKDWGGDGLMQRFGDVWREFGASVGGWLQVVHAHGPAAVEAAYREVLEGRARPEQGHMLSLQSS